ncbi:hypothetical protein D915_006498 [Fasciola hepatica]|uniref:F-box domain-containing protein n=1 Tax=Fasciola hepatica TaxID=6192 RepID=A0A4E0RX93_FASHE|nr:hypothetical protein D915_006498 [Fasciola hepatica]
MEFPPTISLDDLPNELLLQVFSYISQYDLLSCVSRVNSKWFRLARTQSLWSHVDLSARPLKLPALRRLSKLPLIGPHTFSLSIRFSPDAKLSGKTLTPLLHNCSHLKKLEMTDASLISCTELLAVVPVCLNSLKLCRLRCKRPGLLELSQVQLPRLTSLDVSQCAWITDPYLVSLMGINNLVNLNVTGCYRLFGGTPRSLRLNERMDRICLLLERHCSGLRRLSLASVLTLPLDRREIASTRPDLLSSIPQALTQLSHVDLSDSRTLVQLFSSLPKSQGLMAAQSFWESICPDPSISECFKSKVTLVLGRWPPECVVLFVEAAQDLTSQCSVCVFVDEVSLIDPHLSSSLPSNPLVRVESLISSSRRKLKRPASHSLRPESCTKWPGRDGLMA